MKKASTVIGVLALAVFLAVSGSAVAAETNGGKNEMGIQEVYDFIKGCEYYFLATMDGDQPRVRPFGSLALFEGKIYFQTGKVKNVSKQMAVNPKIEICAYDRKGNWIRVQAVAVNDDRREAKQFLLDAYPALRNRYSADDGNTQVLYLKDAKARFQSFTDEEKVVEF
jgi:uncharacterized pyridoxamine 5'-phosphate oxidase family protein